MKLLEKGLKPDLSRAPKLHRFFYLFFHLSIYFLAKQTWHYHVAETLSYVPDWWEC